MTIISNLIGRSDLSPETSRKAVLIKIGFSTENVFQAPPLGRSFSLRNDKLHASKSSLSSSHRIDIGTTAQNAIAASEVDVKDVHTCHGLITLHP